MSGHHITLVALTLGVALLLGNIPLEAAAPSFMPTTTRETVLFKACSAKKNAERKKEVEERLKKKYKRSRGTQTKKPAR